MNTHVARLLDRYPALSICETEIQDAIELLTGVYRSGRKLLICGNGGSAADSEHIVGELMKGFMKRRPLSSSDSAKLVSGGDPRAVVIAQRLQGALPAIALTSQVSLNTAVANDTHGDMIFAQQVFGWRSAGDALLGISTSGESRNVINAFIVGRAFDLKTIALTGRDGGALVSLADVAIRVPADSVDQIQELHLPVYHALCMELEERFFAS